ncbi:unnamed protein product [Brassica rapa]|uniref:Legume lectin domain-containing protein n=1 Tax=Brassica campestris TaxID=3711 RepID=A0A8D9I2T4_BRACM|nr:unnamed protein product [Brassica rapa]
MASWLLQILVISSLHLISLSSQQETRFVYENFRDQDNLYLDDSAKDLGPLRLTGGATYETGRAFYKKPIQFSSSGPLSFSTHFVCALVPRTGIEGGHGLTFLLSSSMDFPNARETRYLGAFNESTSGFPVLAVELDTIRNQEFGDIDNNHVGIDVNSPISVGIASASYYSDLKGKNESINLLSGKPIQVWVDYEGTVFNVSISPLQVQKPSRPLLSHPINLSEIFPNISQLFVGFSAATGNAVSAHYILWWSFSTNRESLPRLDISRLLDISELLEVLILQLHIRVYRRGLLSWLCVWVLWCWLFLQEFISTGGRSIQKCLKHGRRSLMHIGSLTSPCTKQQRVSARMSS